MKKLNLGLALVLVYGLTCKIEILDSAEGIYLYQEQALTKSLEHP